MLLDEDVDVRLRLVLRPRSQALEHLRELVGEVERTITDLTPGQVVEVRPPTE